MLFTGRVFDRVTLGALIIALGLLVDDAIIAIEHGREAGGRLRSDHGRVLAPMLAGTLVAIIGFMPIGFARSTAGEYAGNIFWVTGYALITSWVVAVVFSPISA
ncbi:MAG: efflux RND transporter permease subunit [Methylocella sp.]